MTGRPTANRQLRPAPRRGFAWRSLRGGVLGLALGLALALGGCGAPPETPPETISSDLQYVLDKLDHGSRDERGDALALLVADSRLYPVAEPRLRELVIRENDLFLRERLIDGLGVMATARLWGARQVAEFGIPRQATATGYTQPPEPPEDDPTAAVLERLIHESNPYIIAHARAARARIGVRRGLWGLILALEDRDIYPEIADLSLQLLREVTGLHLTGEADAWWALYARAREGTRYVDLDFARRAAEKNGL